jgi:hypothetical protein
MADISPSAIMRRTHVTREGHAPSLDRLITPVSAIRAEWPHGAMTLLQFPSMRKSGLTTH